MNKSFLAFTSLIFIGISLISCNNDVVDPHNRGVEFYLLESLNTTGQHYFQIDETSVKTKDEPLLLYSDLIAYNSNEYSFTISEHAKSRIKDQDHNVSGIAFAVKANDELIYTGYFWPSYSSSSCDWVVIDPYSINQENTMKVRIGYPGLVQGVNVPDNRNHPEILRIFGKDKKLID